MKEYNEKNEKSIVNANYIHIIGKINGKFAENAQNDRKQPYSTKVETERKSGTKDVLPLFVAEKMEDGSMVEIWGRVRTRMQQGRKLIYIQAEQIRPTGAAPMNEAYLEGTLCKDAIFRKTPAGREITDLMIASNGGGTSAYVPCICFGMNARRTGGLPVGTKVQLWGRMQSRTYKEVYTAYEIAANRIEVIL